MNSIFAIRNPLGWNPVSAVNLILFTLFAYLLVGTAWVCDDAYIVFRVVDNFVNGYGLRWNIADRVQVFTNPLWTLLMSFFYYFTREAYFTSLTISFLVSIAAAAILVFRAADKTSSAIFLSALIFSRAFMDYSSSGLENPLTHLLLVLFFLMYLGGSSERKTFFLLSLVTSLGMLNRMDTAILFAPALFHVYWTYRNRGEGMKILIVGFLPFIAWEIFSLGYYGFLFPNTAYAKLRTGIPAIELMVQGVHYLENSLLNDPVTSTAIGATLTGIAFRREGRELVVGFGIALHLLYVVVVGGDFMSGRFLAAPFVVSLAVAGNMLRSERSTAMLRYAMVATIAGIGLILCPRPPVLSKADFGSHRGGLIDQYGIADERAWYYQFTGLLKFFQGIHVPNFPYAGNPRPEISAGWVGLRARNIAEKNGRWCYVNVSSVGFFGYFAGPPVHIVDKYGLVDAFIARMPMESGPWRIGHFERVQPEGYPETVASGMNVIRDRRIATFYEKIAIITRGDLVSVHRLKTIMVMNLSGFGYPPLAAR